MRKSVSSVATAPLASGRISWPSPFSPLVPARAARKSVCVVSAALIAAALVSLLSLFSPQVQARAPQDAVIDVPAVKGDRIDLERLGTGCSQREWPYFETACMRQASNWTAPVRQPRMVSVDRVPPQDASAMVAER